MQFGAAAIGLGGLGQLSLEVLATLEDVEMIAGADVSAEARAVFERTFDAPAYAEYETLLADHSGEIDLALIVTPHTLHHEQALACLESGVHVYLEKPMVTDVDDAVELLEVADRNDCELQVGYQRHFHPGFLEIKRLVETGRIGDLHTADAYLGQNWIDLHEGSWRVEPSLSGGGQLYDTGSHLLDAVLWLTGAKPISVSAHVSYASPKVDVNSALSLRLERDADDRSVLASVTVSGDGVNRSPSEGYAIWGSDGRIAFDGEVIRLEERNGMVYESQIDAPTDFSTLTTAKLTNFLESITGEAEPAVPGDVGLQVTALTEATYLADEEGREVDVQSLIDDALE
ncbi:Gfo/Idh/MocA family protein [Natronobacterium gregoryi]|uniref:Dehydrogenase n=2 Tax=Natronobacterium gregoryi TaxID=44930 RepID=L0AD88_NATGS|nr:Gfo/Idh/MocA family oxidoreductase [Natronobacterium gregoryi]AFZ71811.1 putative dehydrogenase [Natronobacterium gregoryi SP2]ELY72958.1 dehydrogenase, putative [Natronobacterium gregoryi SP2]PLK21008.1 gfo/Idh/MocA family oxidoreductase [Natronobacterium gregoryi SP2]SFI87281.1 Predicted dehydrogenase [Natronobacterium gregoryi]